MKQLINQNAGSEKYGNCELCKKPADTIYSLNNIFGHKDCLIRRFKHNIKYTRLNGGCISNEKKSK